MFVGESPFDNYDGSDFIPLHLNILYKEPDYAKPALISNPKAITFIKRCLTKNPAERPNALELLEDPFVHQGVKLAEDSDDQENQAEWDAYENNLKKRDEEDFVKE